MIGLQIPETKIVQQTKSDIPNCLKPRGCAPWDVLDKESYLPLLKKPKNTVIHYEYPAHVGIDTHIFFHTCYHSICMNCGLFFVPVEIHRNHTGDRIPPYRNHQPMTDETVGATWPCWNPDPVPQSVFATQPPEVKEMMTGWNKLTTPKLQPLKMGVDFYRLETDFLIFFGPNRIEHGLIKQLKSLLAFKAAISCDKDYIGIFKKNNAVSFKTLSKVTFKHDWVESPSTMVSMWLYIRLSNICNLFYGTTPLLVILQELRYRSTVRVSTLPGCIVSMSNVFYTLHLGWPF